MSEVISYINQILAFVIFGVATNLVMGYGGIYATGPAAFGAITGYTVVEMGSHYGMPYLVALAFGVACAMGLGLVVGLVMLRLDQLWVILLTLGVQLVVVGVATGITSLGGAYGIQVTKPLHLFGATLFSPESVFLPAAVFTVLSFAVAWRLGESPYGRVLRGTRDDMLAARALGKNVYFHRLSIFVITCGMAGVAGGIISTITQNAAPESFDFNQSVLIISMVVIGGLGNLIGTVLGATLLVLLTPFFIYALKLSSNVASLAQLVAFGTVLTLIVLFRPKGIIPEGTFRWRQGSSESRPTVLGGAGPEVGVRPITLQESVAGDSQPAGLAPAVVEVHNAAKSFGAIRAVDGLSLELPQGKISALIGPNGAGKTTVFNLLTGVLPLDEGKVLLKGETITGLRPDQIAHAGMVRSFQDVRLFGGMSAIENVMFGVRDQPGEHLNSLFFKPGMVRQGERSVRRRAFECLEFVGMAGMAQSPASSLGYGQQKLVSLARLLATDAEVLLLDEPMSGIDHHALDEILGLVLKLRDIGRTICVVEHSLDVVRQLADHIFFMELGRITAEGSFDELTSDQRLSQVYFGVGG